MHAIEAALRKSDRSATDVRQTRATDAAHNLPGHEAGAYRGKYAFRVGRFNVVYARLQESDQRRILGRQADLSALAENREAI
jgi:hypothetical protein